MTPSVPVLSDFRPLGSLRLHPDAERVPLPGPSDLSALRDSLREYGQQDPLDITDDGVILDGRTRWTLLAELGEQAAKTRVVDVPADKQTDYIIDRAIARRHLTAAQKRALNDILRAHIIEVREPSETTKSRGRTEPLRIGYSQAQRAEKLGVETRTVQRWDDEAGQVTTNVVTSSAPTHAIDGRGRPQPLHKPPRTKPAKPPVRKAPPPDRPLDLEAGDRNVVIAKKARERALGGVAQLLGLTQAISALNFGNVGLKAQQEELAHLDRQIDEVIRLLRDIQKRMKGSK